MKCFNLSKAFFIVEDDSQAGCAFRYEKTKTEVK